MCFLEDTIYKCGSWGPRINTQPCPASRGSPTGCDFPTLSSRNIDQFCGNCSTCSAPHNRLQPSHIDQSRFKEYMDKKGYFDVRPAARREINLARVKGEVCGWQRAYPYVRDALSSIGLRDSETKLLPLGGGVTTESMKRLRQRTCDNNIAIDAVNRPTKKEFSRGFWRTKSF